MHLAGERHQAKETARGSQFARSVELRQGAVRVEQAEFGFDVAQQGFDLLQQRDALLFRCVEGQRNLGAKRMALPSNRGRG